MISTARLLILCLLLNSPLIAEELHVNWEEYERIIVPVAVGPAGAFGSLWESRFVVFNGADVPVQLFQGDPRCRVPTGCAPFPERVQIPPRSAGEPELVWGGLSHNFGALLYSPKIEHEHLSFHHRIRDVSRGSGSRGTELPVVRESEVAPSGIRLLDIPVDSSVRHTLRIYNFYPDRSPDSPAILRVHAWPEGELLAEEMITVHGRTPPFDEIPLNPGYTQLNADFLNPLFGSADAVMMEILPTSSGQLLWAFVTVTHNETQHVTTVTPQ